MANNDLLAQAKEIQRQKLLAQAKAIQAQKMSSQNDQPQDTLSQAKELGLKGLSAVGKGLDYVGGVTRTGLAAPFMKSVTAQDVVNALKANPLSGEEILNRAGVSKGGSLSDVIPGAYSETGDEWLKLQKGGWADPSARGAGGLALEMATDPLTLASFGTAGVAKAAMKAGRPLTNAEKLLQVTTRPIGYGLEEAGKKRYSSALRGVDESLKSAGKPPVSSVFLQNEMPIGSMQTLRKKSEEFAKKAGQTIGNIESQATEKGATVNMLPAMNDSIELASEMRKSPHPNVQAAGQKLDDITQSYLEKGEKVPLDKAREWASEANKLASEQAFNPMTAGNVPFASQSNREIGQGLKGEVYKSIENTTPELKSPYDLANQQYSSLASKDAKREFKSAAKAERKKNGITQVDLALTGATAINPHFLGVLGAKTGARLGNSAIGRTATGRGLYELGNKGDVLLRRPSVWQDLYNKYYGPEEDNQ